LVHRPKVLLLDEPSLGLDVQTRRRMWWLIEKLRAGGTTVLITTHYLDEADALCDRVAIIEQGEIRGLDTPDALKQRYGGPPLLHRPKVLLLDEPSLGLDVQTRRRMWWLIEKLRAGGTTVLITTHYLDEADALCDRVAIIEQGEIRGLDTPDALKQRYGGPPLL